MRWFMPKTLIIFATLLLTVGSVRSAEERPEKILWTAGWNSSGSQFAVGGVDTLWLYDAKTFRRKSLLPKAKVQGVDDTEIVCVTSVAWHPIRNCIAVSSQGGNVNGIYDIGSGTRIPLDVDHGRGVDWRTDGEILATTSPGDGHLRIWKTDGSLLQDIPRHKQARSLTGVAWQPSGNVIVTIGRYITLHGADGRVTKQISHRPNSKGECLLLCVEWHPSGKFFAVGDYGNTETGDPPTIQFWSDTGNLIKTISVDGGAEFRNVSWNHKGTLLASASDKLRIWTQAGALKDEGDSPDLLWGVDWHPSRPKLLTSSAEGRVSIWTPDGKVVKKVVDVKGVVP